MEFLHLVEPIFFLTLILIVLAIPLYRFVYKPWRWYRWLKKNFPLKQSESEFVVESEPEPKPLNEVDAYRTALLAEMEWHDERVRSLPDGPEMIEHDARARAIRRLVNSYDPAFKGML